MKNENKLQFIRVNSEGIENYMISAKERIIFVKPAFMKLEIETLLDATTKRNINCIIYMEQGDNAIRLGFGETAALELIQQNLSKIDVHLVERIRMGILIVDNSSLFYTPTIAYIEDEDIESLFPNGCFLDEVLTVELIKEFERNSTKELRNSEPKNVIPFPGCKITDSEEMNVESEIKECVKVLKSNPAVDPVKLKKVNFYRNNYKIVKIQELGIKIENKKISLRPFLSLLSEHNEKDIRSWGVFTNEDIKKLQDTLDFRSELEEVKNNYLLDAGRFGYILDVKNKKEFLESINKLKEEFTEYFTGKIEVRQDNRFVKLNNEKDNEDKITLQSILEKNRSELIGELISYAKQDNEFIENAIKRDRDFSYDLRWAGISEEEALNNFIKRFVNNNLKYPTEQDIFDHIDIKIDYYDISDELINDNEDFQSVIKKCSRNDNQDNGNGLVLRQYLEGYEQ